MIRLFIYSILISLIVATGHSKPGEVMENRLENLCQESPSKRFALFPIKILDEETDKIRYKSLSFVEVAFSDRPKLENSFFKVVDGFGDKASKNTCENLRAINLYTHLNYIHQEFYAFKDDFPLLFKEFNRQTLVRFDVKESYSFAKYRVKKKEMYGAVTTCGHMDHKRKRIVRKKELWFQKARYKKHSWRKFLPYCFLGLGKNSQVCAEVTSLETSLMPHVIYHEYIHLITSHLFGSCQNSVFDEALSNFFAMYFIGEEWVNYRVPRSLKPSEIDSHRYKDFSEKEMLMELGNNEWFHSVAPSYALKHAFNLEASIGRKATLKKLLGSLVKMSKLSLSGMSDSQKWQVWMDLWKD